MLNHSLKLISATALTFAFASGTALAGDKKDCDHKKKASMKTEAAMTASPATDVLAATESRKADMKKAKKVYSFDEALEICQKKDTADLQACIDYKTGKVTTKAKS